jgi:predicted hydrocarbon binding protein
MQKHMEYNISQEEALKIIHVEGEARGVVFKTDKNFILKKGGEEKLKEVEKELEKMGYPLLYNDIETMNFYPFGVRVLSLLAIAKVFNLDSEGVKEIGVMAPKASVLIRVFTKYFLSVEQTLKKVGEIWEKHSTVGKAEAQEVNGKEGYAIFHFSNLNFHPIYCVYMSGYLSGIITMAVSKEVNIEETRCSFRGGEVHEFKATWEA